MFLIVSCQPSCWGWSHKTLKSSNTRAGVGTRPAPLVLGRTSTSASMDTRRCSVRADWPRWEGALRLAACRGPVVPSIVASGVTGRDLVTIIRSVGPNGMTSSSSLALSTGTGARRDRLALARVLLAIRKIVWLLRAPFLAGWPALALLADLYLFSSGESSPMELISLRGTVMVKSYGISESSRTSDSSTAGRAESSTSCA